MANVKFLSAQKVKDNSRINGNVDNKLLDPLILECQQDYILPIIGSGIYNQLITQITASTLTALNITLLDDYIVPCLIKYIEYEAPHYLNFKFTNANVGKKNTDESTPVNLEEMEVLMDRIKKKAEVRAERITKYLKTNYTSYPLYLNPGSTHDTVFASRTNYTCGMVLDDDICNRCGEYRCDCMIGMQTSDHS